MDYISVMNTMSIYNMCSIYWTSIWIYVEILHSVSSQDITLTTSVGAQVTIPCQLDAVYPGWNGPYSGGSRTYNLEGFSIFTTFLGEKKDRLTWDNSKNIIIDSVVRESDDGTYVCSAAGKGAYITRLIVRAFFGGGRTTDVPLAIISDPSGHQVSPDPPEISNSETLSDKTRPVVRGSQDVAMNFICISRGGYPKPTVNWYEESVSGSPLTSSEQVEDNTDSFTVTRTHQITPTRTDDRKNFICQSSYDTEPRLLNSSDMELYLDLKPEGPLLTGIVSPKESSSTVTLANCGASGFRPASPFSLTWTYNGNTRVYDGSPQPNIRTETFYVNDRYDAVVGRTDNGQILTCTVDHTTLASPLINTSTLNVLFGPDTVSILGNKEFIATGNSRLTLSCTTASSNPQSNIIWRNGTSTISNNRPYTTEDGQYNGKVRVQELWLYPTRYDDGNSITCLASNNIPNQQPVSTTVILDLTYPPDKDPTIVGFSDSDKYTYKMIRNSKAEQRLTCSISDGRPLPTLSWICYTGRTSMNVTGKTTYTTLRWDAGDQERTCICQADHTLLIQPKSTYVAVEILYPPNSPRFEVGTDIVESPFPIVVTEGTNLSVNCISTDGNPMPHQYTWTLPDGTTRNGQQLEILNIQTFGNNLYTCTAQNTMIPSVGTPVTGTGSSAVIMLLRFSPRPSIHVPLVTNKSVELNTSTMLTFTATAYPIPDSSDFVWQICKYTICESLIDGDVTGISTIGLATNLTIHNVLGTNIGRYKLIVSNGIGNDFEQDYFVTLQDKPNIPTQFDYLDDSISTSSVTLVWLPGFNGGLPQTFVIQYKPVSDHGKWTSVDVAAVSEGIMHFTLTNLRSGTEYSVRMLAYNAVNQSDVTADIIFKTNLEDVPKTSSIALIGGIVGGCIGAVVIITVIVAIMLIRKRRQGMPKNTSNESQASAYTELSVTRSASTVYDPIQISDTPEQTDDRTEPSNTSTQADPTQYENTQNTHELESTDNKEQIQSTLYANA